MSTKRHSVEPYLVAIIMVFLLILPALLFTGPSIPTVFNDEFGYWATASYFVGHDWSEVFSKISYYSYGYGLILSIILLFSGSTIVAYKIAIFINGLWLSLSYLFLYKTSRILYANKSLAFNLFLPFCAVLFASNIAQIHYTWPECFLFMLFCAMTYIVTLLSKKDSIVLSSVLALLSVYSYAVHQRTLGIIIATFMIMFIYLITSKISLKSFATYILIICALILCVLAIRRNVIAAIWNGSSVVEGNNASGQVGKVKHILSLGGLKDLALSLVGKSYYAVIASSGLVIITVISSAQSLIKSKSDLKNIIGVRTFLILALLGTIGISAISLVIPRNVTHIVYGRYTDNVMGPFIMIGIADIASHGISKRASAIITTIVSALSVGVLYNLVSVNLQYQASINNAGIAKFVSNVDINIFLLSFLALIMLIIMITISNSSLKTGTKSILLGVVLTCYFVFYGSSAYEMFDVIWGEVGDSSIKCASVLQEISESYDINITAIMANNGYPSQYSGNGIQFVLKDKTIDTISIEDFELLPDSGEETNWNVYVIYTDSISENIYEVYYLYNCDNYSILIDRSNNELVSAFADIVTDGGS